MENKKLAFDFHQSVIECEKELLFIAADAETKTCHGIVTLENLVDIDNERGELMMTIDAQDVKNSDDIREDLKLFMMLLSQQFSEVTIVRKFQQSSTNDFRFVPVSSFSYLNIIEHSIYVMHQSRILELLLTVFKLSSKLIINYKCQTF